jgi:hypothetical protein
MVFRCNNQYLYIGDSLDYVLLHCGKADSAKEETEWKKYDYIKNRYAGCNRTKVGRRLVKSATESTTYTTLQYNCGWEQNVHILIFEDGELIGRDEGERGTGYNEKGCTGL